MDDLNKLIYLVSAIKILEGKVTANKEAAIEKREGLSVLKKEHFLTVVALNRLGISNKSLNVYSYSSPKES